MQISLFPSTYIIIWRPSCQFDILLTLLCYVIEPTSQLKDIVPYVDEQADSHIILAAIYFFKLGTLQILICCYNETTDPFKIMF